MLLSISIGVGYLQSEGNIHRTSIEHIKSVFRIDPLSVRGFKAVSAIVMLSLLLYQLMIYYNCKKNTSNPKSIKYMLGTW
jgi:hypothetical protein